ncbi:hypothetical protein M514_27794 [Trichuris suis]|uniref:Uncharacterized protein n=1 Tax=Trichuris suis TaxID=68888 RepID=A0A085MS32_9BILA|nr:hypothetical protein M514_27794 [Trichuris suis]
MTCGWDGIRPEGLTGYSYPLVLDVGISRNHFTKGKRQKNGKENEEMLFPEGTDMSLCKQSKQDEFAPQTEKKSNSCEQGH